MSGNTMGESTRRRVSAAIQGGAMGGTGGRAGVPVTSVGGYGGGLGGTWGKASRGLVNDPHQGNAGAAGQGQGGRSHSANDSYRAPPAGGGPLDGPRQEYVPPANRQAVGQRPRVRSAATTSVAAWDKPKELPRAPAPGTTSAKVPRAKNATAGAAKPWGRESMGVSQTEFKLSGQGLEANRLGGSPAAGGAATMGRPPVGSSPAARTPGGGGPSPGFVPQNARMPEDSRDELAAMRAAGGGGQLTDAHLMTLEDAIRDAVRMKRSVYEGSKEMLMRLFKSVDDGSGDVDINEFIAVCDAVGVVVSPEEAHGLFRRFGFDTVLPYERFAHQLLNQPARQLAEDMPMRKGAFVAGQNADFHGKILYKPCRKPVYTPSDWDPALAERSADLPNSRLVLEFVYGYQGKDNPAQNLFYTSENKVVYYTAGVGVVYQRSPVHHQYFFLGHNDDITALGLCPAAVDYDGKQYPAKTLVATGQVTSVDNGPYICIWDSRTGSQPDGPAAASEVCRLEFDKDARGFCALAFGPSGNRLAAVAQDNYHTVYVYDWRKRRELFSGRGQMGDPPQVYGLEWNPYEISHKATPGFLQFGKKHLKLWSGGADGTANWSSKPMSFGRLGMQNVTSAQWLPPRSGAGGEQLVVVGVDDGQLYVFKGMTAVKAIAAHRPGPKVVQSDGHPAHGGVRGLRGAKGGAVLLSGGADGTVLQWDTSDGNIQEARFAGRAVQLKSPFGPADKNVPQIRALDYSAELDRILVGTNNCDVCEVSETTEETLMDGHAGDVWFCAFHPTNPNVFATVSDSGHVHLWDGAIRQMTHCAALGWKPRAVAFSHCALSAGGCHIAVGGAKGHIKILSEAEHLRPLHEAKDSKEGIADLKYAPNDRMLAAATFDATVDLYSVDKGYQRVARCSGHSGTVRGIDWSADGSLLQSYSGDYELLFWNARTGKQMTLPQRDVDWHTFTSVLGFPVMGVWPAESDGTDVNTVDRAHSRQLLATADDFGMVKLFNYPCVVDDAPHRAYRGHSSHVMCVRFSCDDSLVCSTGGHDWAVFQFRLVHLDPAAAPPPEPEPVWGPLDESGRAYGYTRNPARLASASPTASASPPPPMHGGPSPPVPQQQPPGGMGVDMPGVMPQPHQPQLGTPAMGGGGGGGYPHAAPGEPFQAHQPGGVMGSPQFDTPPHAGMVPQGPPDGMEQMMMQQQQLQQPVQDAEARGFSGSGAAYAAGMQQQQQQQPHQEGWGAVGASADSSHFGGGGGSQLGASAALDENPAPMHINPDNSGAF